MGCDIWIAAPPEEHPVAAPHRRLIPSLALLLLVPAVRAEPPARTDALGDPLPAGAVARLGTIRFRDGNSIYNVAVATDGKSVAFSSSRGIRFLDIATGKELRTTTHRDFFTYSPDGKLFGAGDYTGRLFFWDAEGKPAGEIAPLTTFEAGGLQNSNRFAFSRDHRYVVTGTNNIKREGKLQAVVFEVATGKTAGRVEVPHNGDVRGALSDDGKVLATFGDYYPPKQTAEEQARAAELKRTVELWDVATGKELSKVRIDDKQWVANVAFLPGGKEVVVASRDGLLTVWDVAAGKEVRRLAGRRGTGTLLAVSPDGKTVAAGSFYDGAVQTFDAAAGRRLAVYEAPPRSPRDLTFTTDGRLLLAGMYGQASVFVWDVLAAKSLTPDVGHRQGVSAVAFTPDGKGVISTSHDATLRFWGADGKETRQVKMLTDETLAWAGSAPYNVVLSPDGKLLLAATTGGVALLDTNSGREGCRLAEGFAGGRVAAAFSPDSSLLLSTTQNIQNAGKAVEPEVRLYDVASAKVVRRFEGSAGKNLPAVAYAPDGKAVAAAKNLDPGNGPSEVRLWETGGKLVWKVDLKSLIQGLAFAPDGKSLAVLYQTGVVTLHAADDGHELSRMGGQVPAERAEAFAFSPDSRLLAVPFNDSFKHTTVVRVYEAATGAVRHEFTGHDGPVPAVAFAPDGKRLATGGNDTTVLLWDLSAEAPK
jgi:WD40 repeat protein